MSSSYHPICLDHSPPIVLDGSYRGFTADDVPEPPTGHERCRLAVGRWSGGLVQLWLPMPYSDADGQHGGRWYDVSWLHRFPEIIRVVEGAL